MCGIVGYIGEKTALPVLMKGLARLEYRGYDSAGVACLNHTGSGLFVVKEKGKLGALREKVSQSHFSGSIGIGHTRWATHGEPSRENAHPHVDCENRLALVHNGIVENYELLRRQLILKGHHFRSETDTEVLVHLIEEYDRGDVVQAIRRAVQEARGHFAFVLISTRQPEKLFVFKRSNPLVVGVGRGENFVASDVPALLPYTREVLYLEDNEYAVIEKRGVQIFSLENYSPVRRKKSRIEWSVTEAEKGGYPHFMLKEIHEQPRILEGIIRKHVDRNGEILFEDLEGRAGKRLQAVEKVFLVSCGTAYHAGLVANYLLEDLAGIPAAAHVSSEFRYSAPLIGRKDAVVFVTQSGETADTLAALRLAKAKGALTLAIVNVVGSSIAREADIVIYTHAGPEIGVASTKAYTAQLAIFVLWTIFLARLRGRISKQFSLELIRKIRAVPCQAEQVLKLKGLIKRAARKYYQCRNFLYLGRGYNFPSALEGALKLKEITYSHAHGYPAGEMKHGPIALIDRELPILCICPESKTYEKMISNIEEIRARGGIVITIGTEGDKVLQGLSRDFFPIPKTLEALSPILTAIPLQLFAYYVAALNGRDVDQPRNLAKSVTVE